MGKVHQSIVIDAPLDQVWDLMCDASRLAEWQSTVVQVTQTTGRLDQVGSTYTTTNRIAGRPIQVSWEVTAVEPRRSFDQVASSPRGGSARATNRAESSNGGTRVTTEIDYELPGGFLAEVANKLFAERSIDREIRHSLENLKALVETEVAVAAAR
jgi:uncharacterized membrane protein